MLGDISVYKALAVFDPVCTSAGASGLSQGVCSVWRRWSTEDSRGPHFTAG